MFPLGGVVFSIEQQAMQIFREGVRMEEIRDYFLCDSCENKEFKLVYSFSMRFHNVNFSDDVIYDKIIDELYECTKCQKTFTKNEIEAKLAQFKKMRKKS